MISVALAQLAQAQTAPAPDPLVEGRRQFDIANQELNLGHYEKALEHLEASYRLTNKAALLYNLGFVNRQLFSRTRNLAYLTRAIDLYRTFLDGVKGTSPKELEQRDRAAKELKAAEDDLAREQAARAKGEEALGLGEQFVGEGRLDDAREQLEGYRRGAGNERPGVVRAYLLEATIAVKQGDVAAASEAYARALALDKSVALPPDATDEQRRAFTQAQLRVGDAPALAVAHTPPGSLKPGAPVELTFVTSPDPLKLERGLQLHYRAGSGAFSTLPPQPVGRVALPRAFTATLLPGARVDYYAEVVDEHNAVLQHLGAPSLPFTVEVEKPPPKSVAKKWWFWTAMGGVAAAIAVGVGVGVTLSEPPRQTVTITTGQSLRFGR